MRMTREKLILQDYLPVTLTMILFLSQIIAGIFLLPSISQDPVLAYLGVGLCIVSGLVFGMLPAIELRKAGGVSEHESYIHTTRLVDSGIYSVVRHPQYVTWIWWAIGNMLIFQHWLVFVLGVWVIPLVYLDAMIADRHELEKFGDGYRQYMNRVPRANVLLGIIRRIRGRLERS
jgi:protein-S-isoprenylcysteine O-methyltransferase Ste14